MSITIISIFVIGLLIVSADAAPETNDVTRNGSQLLLNGKPFRFSGGNVYWLGLDENVPPGTIAYPTKFRQTDALLTAVGMGARVIRSHTLGISCGNPLSFEPTLNVFNDSALDAADYAVFLAQKYGLKLIIPLTDNYHYFHGGKHCYTDWLNISDENEFYSDPAVIAAFQMYVKRLLTHINKYTGKPYFETDAILAWETGNELFPLDSWTALMAKFIKTVDHRHLVLSGTFGLRIADLENPDVDLSSDHFYPPSVSRIQLDAGLGAAYSKVIIAGEFGWSYNASGEQAGEFISAMECLPALGGDLYWSLFPHLDTFGFVQHGDGFTMHYPGDWPFMKTINLALSEHANAMNSPLAVPLLQDLAPVVHPLLPLTPANTSLLVTWRGVALAENYTVYGQNPPEDVVYVLATGVSDVMLPLVVPNGERRALCVTVQAVRAGGRKWGSASNQQCWGL
jgi:mannan endo-1,4-beta-mannosidase